MVKSFYIYLPPDYAQPDQQQQRYPVLYLFRGHEREWVNLHEDSSRGGRSIVDVYLELYRKGQVGPMILVCPGISSDDFHIPGLLVDFKQPELAEGAKGVGSGRFESYFLKELVTYVDFHYRTLPDRRHRGVDGFSLGGFQAIKIAAQYPAMFSTSGAYDGTFFYPSRDGKRISGKDGLFRAELFDPAFGKPRDMEFAAANNPANLIMNAHPRDLASIFWMIQTGPVAAEPMNANYYRGKYVVDLLEGKKIPNRVPLVLSGGLHNWATADRHMALTLPLHWQILSGQFLTTAPFTQY
ncbi:MAG TPA: alpha/beta hydrolase-fold protein [Chloroflexia bacterium]|nr:alpha/beta hydrolase-fold protein [Chloroflexia bacterium]